MPHDARSKANFISRLKLERVKKNLCDAHNSVASRDALTRRRGANRRSGDGLDGLRGRPQSTGQQRLADGSRLLINSQGSAASLRYAADTWRTPPPSAKRPAGAFRPAEDVSQDTIAPDGHWNITEL
jgi:hypothetical protein